MSSPRMPIATLLVAVCLLPLLALVGAQTSDAEQQQDNEFPVDPCAIVRCGWGATCRVDENNRPRCECPDICPAIYRPVCGSDGVTYSNECQMQIRACNTKRHIYVVSDGPCPGVKRPMPIMRRSTRKPIESIHNDDENDSAE